MNIILWTTTLLGLLNLPQQSYHVGRATYYHPGLMARVARHRGLGLGWAQSYGTNPDCHLIGRYEWTSLWDPVLQRWDPWTSRRIVDCSQPWDLARHLREGLIEVPYQDAVAAHFVGEGRTQVRWKLAP